MKKVTKKSPPKERKATVSFTADNNYYPVVILVLLLVTFAASALASHFSFLYIFNNSTQTNGLLTMGRSILAGMVPYRDLFDNQGILLYFIYALAAFIPGNGLGVWILEWAFLFAGCLAIYKIGRLYMSSLFSLAASIVMAFAITCLGFYGTGGSGSAFGLPLMLWAAYAALKGFATGQTGLRSAFIVGVLGGINFFIDPGFTGFYAAYALMACVVQLFKRKWLDALLEILWVFMGAAIPTLLVILYFSLNSTLAAFFELYFRLNWSAMEPMSLLQRLEFAWNEIYSTIMGSYILMGALGAALLAIIYQRKISAWLFIPLAFAATGISIYFAGTASAVSFLPLSTFGLFGVLLVFYLFFEIWQHLPAGKGFITFLAFLAALAGSGWLIYDGDQWKTIMERRRSYAVLELAKVIKETDDAVLLNYGAPDQGLYLAADVLPAQYYYQLSIEPDLFEDNLKNQLLYIQDAKPDFVLVTLAKGQTDEDVEKALSESYQEFGQYTEENEGQTVSYTLYKRKSS